ncbi:unnamed protein product, partial [Closterium sp. NIES-64]
MMDRRAYGSAPPVCQARRGEPESTPADIEAMVVELMVPPHRLIVFLQQSSVEWCSSLWLDVVRRADPQLRRTVIVASKFDNRLKGLLVDFSCPPLPPYDPRCVRAGVLREVEVDRYLSTGGYFHSATSPPPATAAAAAASPFVSPRPAPCLPRVCEPWQRWLRPSDAPARPLLIALPKDTKDRDKEKGAAGVGSTGSTERDGGASEGVQERFDERRYGAQIGFAKLKAFLEDEMQRSFAIHPPSLLLVTRYSAAAPAVLAQLERRCADVAEQVACVEQRLSAASDVASMRRLAMRHVVATTSAMWSPTRPSGGLSTHEEQAASTVGHWPGVPPHAFLHAARSLRRCKGEDGEEGEEEREEEEGEGVGDGSGVGGSGGSRGGVVNEGLRLYGGAALMRVVHEFSIAAWAVANALLAKQAAFGSSGVRGVSSAAVGSDGNGGGACGSAGALCPADGRPLCAHRLPAAPSPRRRPAARQVTAKQSHHTGFFQSPAAHQSASPSGTVVAPCVALEPFLGFHAATESHTPLPTATRAGKEGGVAKAAAPGADENAWRTERGAMPRHGRIPLYPARPAADNMASARGEEQATAAKWKEYAEISGRLILAGSGLAGSVVEGVHHRCWRRCLRGVMLNVMAMFTAPAAVKKMQAERDAARQRMESLTKCLEDFRSTSGSLLHQLCVTDVSPLALLRLLWHPSYRSGGEIAFAKSLAHRQSGSTRARTARDIPHRFPLRITTTAVRVARIADRAPPPHRGGFALPPSPALARVLNRHRLHPLSAADSAALYGAGYTELGIRMSAREATRRAGTGACIRRKGRAGSLPRRRCRRRAR